MTNLSAKSVGEAEFVGESGRVVFLPQGFCLIVKTWTCDSLLLIHLFSLNSFVIALLRLGHSNPGLSARVFGRLFLFLNVVRFGTGVRGCSPRMR